jgi:CubicO group peptidase (beta-lactamase class C family)
MKKMLKGILLFLLAILVVFSAYALISGRTYLFKAVYYNFADIDDYRIFENNVVTTGTPQPWTLAEDYNKPAPPADLDQLLSELKTIALLVVRNDSLVFERYSGGYSDSSFSGSFSIAKSITSLLIGAAIREGTIPSVDETVSTYLPEFKEGLAAQLTIRHLLTMSSGSDWDESYANPLSVTTESYYGNDLYRAATGVKIVHQPGTLHKYKSGDTELLGLILEKATGKSLSAYASEKLWQPIGAEHPAKWSTDKENGHEKAFCCFNSNARDFARLGQLMLDSGKWKGRPVIDSSFFAQSIAPCGIKDETGQACDYYGFQWWLYPAKTGVFYARGILGQYIIIIPSKRIVIVRLGHERSKESINGAPKEVGALVDWGMSL